MPDEQDDELGRLARVLTGDDRRAADLLGEVAVLASRPSRQADEGYEDRRTLLVERVLRRRQPSTRGHGPAPDPDAELTAPDLATRLARLDPLGRTLLVLRHAEHLTLAELARLTDRSPAAVARALEQAEATADAEPYEIEQLLWDAVAPAAGAVREAERRAAARRRRRRVRIALAGVVVAALLAAGTVLPGVLHEQPYTRSYGEWTATTQLAAQDTYTLHGRQLMAGEEVLGVVSVADPDLTCSVAVTTASQQIIVPDGRKATLGDRPARFVAASPLSDAGLWWSVGPKTSALATCNDQADDQRLLELASLVRFVRSPVRVPFELRGLAAPDEVHTYLDYSGTIGVLVTPIGASEESSDAVFVGLVAASDAGAVSGRRVDVNGSAGRLTDDENETTVCWPSGSRTVCASMINAESSLDRSQQVRRTSRVLRTARLVHLAPDLDEPGTWFDAQDAFAR